MSEAAITFPCGGDSLVGILHRPDREASTIGVLIVVGGPQYRVGSHRQFVLMARGLAEAGYPVLRFDYRGMGDSSGELRTFESVDDDIRAAVDAFMAGVPALQGIVIFGLCDAASAAWLYCAQDERLRGLVLANPWVRTEAGEAKAYVKHYYLRRLVQRSFWRKVLSGGLRPGSSVRSLFTALRRAGQDATRKPTAEPTHFIERMRRGAAAFSHPILILLSDRDLTAREFEALCQDSGAWGELVARPGVELGRVRDADHTFSSRSALEQATRQVATWLAVRAGR